LKNGNTEKFYGNYYAQVPLKSTSFFPGLSHNAATLLATKVADSMLSYCNHLKTTDITQPAQNIFFHTEHYFRQLTSISSLHKIDIGGITKKAVNDSEVISSYQYMVSDAELVTNSHVNKDVFYGIVSLYIRVRSFSFAKDVIQRHKVKAKHTKAKALRKEIMRSCEEQEQNRLG
jgi:hypothetical protein